MPVSRRVGKPPTKNGTTATTTVVNQTTINNMGTGGMTVYSTTADLSGYEASVVITDPNVLSTNTVSIIAIIPPGDADEMEMDLVVGQAWVPSTVDNQWTLFVQATPGPIYGTYTIKYGVS